MAAHRTGKHRLNGNAGFEKTISLANLYSQLNAQFFNNQLPRYRVTFNSTLPPHGRIDSKRRLIQIRHGLNPEQLRQVLLHEMCHIGEPSHGRRFLAKLLRLATQGESWAKDEADRYRNAPSWNQLMRNLRGTLDDVAAAGRRPHFSAVLRWAAEDLGYSSIEFLQKVPWLPAAWNKACREADSLAFSQELMKRRIEEADRLKQKLERKERR